MTGFWLAHQVGVNGYDLSSRKAPLHHDAAVVFHPPEGLKDAPPPVKHTFYRVIQSLAVLTHNSSFGESDRW